MGWAHVLANTSPMKPWLKNSNGIVNTKYCYPDLETEAKLRPALDGGWKIWYERLGNADSGAGHRLGGFSEQTGTREALFCWLDEDHHKCKLAFVSTDARLSSDNIGNPKVPSGTLVVEVSPTKSWGGWATIGFKPEDWDDRQGRNKLQLGWDQQFAGNLPFQMWIAAHEIGHVLGLAHEHQRIH